MCYNTSKIPSQWKQANICPIPKPGSEKYRPIALLPTLSKPLEKLMLKRLREAIPPDPTQFAFRKNRSTLDSIAFLCHSIAKSLDTSGKAYHCCFLDFSSAFNTIDRQRLIDYLSSFNVDKPTLFLLCDFLSNRSQHCTYGRTKSDPLPNNAGVLQGSILSPFLFASYVSNITSGPDFLTIKYADDFVIGRPHSNSDDTSIFRTALTSLHSHATSADLHLNPSKTMEVFFSLSHASRQYLYTNTTNLEVNNCNVTRTTDTLYLGVTLSSDLSWSSHVISIYDKLTRLSFSIRRLRSCKVPQSAIAYFVDACVLPTILYCSPVIFPGLLKKDVTLLRRGLRLIARCGCLGYHTLVEKVISRHFAACNSLAKRVIDDNTHPLHSIIIAHKSNVGTRSAFRIASARTQTYKNSIVPYLCRLLVDETKVKNELYVAFSSRNT